MSSIMRGLSHWWLKPIPYWEILKNVCSGDCVVAFLRREIFELKMAIEKHTNHLYCVMPCHQKLEDAFKIQWRQDCSSSSFTGETNCWKSWAIEEATIQTDSQ